MYKSETPVQDAVLGNNRYFNLKLVLCVILSAFLFDPFVDGFIIEIIVYALGGMGLYVWLLIFYQLFRMMRNSKKEIEPKTYGDVIDGMTEEERMTLHFMVARAIQDTQEKRI